MTRAADPEPTRWLFSNVVFDERSWTLTVDGKPVAVEGKPLALLHQLLIHEGEKVTKEHLLETVWPGVFVVEASLTTAMRKLREAIGDDRKNNRIIETVSGVGYRMIAPVEREVIFVPVRAADASPQDLSPAFEASKGSNGLLAKPRSNRAARASIVAGLAIAASIFATNLPPVTSGSRHAFSTNRMEVLAAIRMLDLAKIEKLNAAGWNPNKPLDSDGNAALHKALEVCEWNPQHDQQKLLLMVRFLYDAGAKIEQRNVWGDTPYSIASATRYCGPNHPATQMLFRDCFGGKVPLGDKCVATYELARRSRS